ncbi:unnamed protein product [Lathyrus oleraceus]
MVFYWCGCSIVDIVVEYVALHFTLQSDAHSLGHRLFCVAGCIGLVNSCTDASWLNLATV